VLYRNLVERTLDSALEQEESVLNRIDVDIPKGSHDPTRSA